MRLVERDKRLLVSRHQKGEPVAHICAESGIARSTLYSWIKLYQVKSANIKTIVTPKEFDSLKRHAEKLEHIVQVLRLVDCTVSSPLKERLDAIESLYGQFSVHVLCEALEVPRGTFYNHIFRNKRDNSSYSKKREELRILIQDIFDENRQIFGAAKIKAILYERDYIASEKLVSELMQDMNLRSITTNSKREYLKWRKGENKNIVQQVFHTNKPNQVWVSDITAFKFKEKFFYICIIMDLFSRKIIAYRLSKKSSTQLTTFTFKQAYSNRQPGGGLIFHSDRGLQYTSFSFQRLLHEKGVTQSLSRPGKPHDNAVAESFFSSLKKEEMYRREYSSEADLKRGVDNYILFYNSRRPHRAMKNKIPDKLERNALME